ncbi:MAG: hypothetical protein AAF216_01990 [Pseudomonadota bacterium]
MIRIVAIALTVACAPAALAQSVTFSPGKWSYEGTARMGPATLSDTGDECFEAGDNAYNLSEAAASIAPGCALVTASPIEAGYSFQLACTGDIKGELSGQITVGEQAGRLVAEGWTGSQDTPVNLSVTATARRIAETCGG